MELMTCGDVAKALGVTPQTIVDAANSGRIQVAMRTVGGIRLFTKTEVERFRSERELSTKGAKNAVKTGRYQSSSSHAVPDDTEAS